MRSIPLLILLLLLPGCNPEADLLRETAREPNASLRFANFRRTLYRGTGGIKWDVRAEEAFIYQEEDKVSRIVVYGFEMDQEDPKDPLFISAERGELNHSTGVLLVEGKILLRDHEGTMESERLTYNMEKKIADSRDPVTLNRKGLHTVCSRGIFFERSADRLVCRSPRGTVESFPGFGPQKPAVKPSAEDIFQ